MLGVCHPKHLALAKKLVIVFLGLGVEARIVIGIPGLRAGRRALQRLIEAANPAIAGIPAPVVVAAIGLFIAKSNESAATLGLGCQHRIEAEQPQAVGLLEVGIDRHRLDLDAADQVITGVMSDLIVLDHVVGLVLPAVHAFAIVEAQIVVVG